MKNERKIQSLIKSNGCFIQTSQHLVNGYRQGASLNMPICIFSRERQSKTKTEVKSGVGEIPTPHDMLVEDVMYTR